MARTLMMMSGLGARVSMLRFPFACAALAAIAAGAYAFAPWAGVLGWMSVGPFGADGFPEGLTCLVVWLWVIVNAIAAVVGLALTLGGDVKLSEYPIWWGALTLDEKTQERHVEVWRVLVWLLCVPADLAGVALLLSVYGLVKLLKYPWRLLEAAATFDLSRLGRGG